MIEKYQNSWDIKKNEIEEKFQDQTKEIIRPLYSKLFSFIRTSNCKNMPKTPEERERFLIFFTKKKKSPYDCTNALMELFHYILVHCQLKKNTMQSIGII